MDVNKTIAIVPVSAKPYHAGHDGLVRIASKENDEVHLLVSITDRSRPGEMKIDGGTMFGIWKDYIENTLPTNVKDFINYTFTAPVTKVYEELKNAELQGSQDIYTIYSDVDDIRKYTDENLKAAAPIMFAKEQILLRGIKRSETVNVSGTKMRELLEDGLNDEEYDETEDEEYDEAETEDEAEFRAHARAEFISLLPSSIQQHGEDIIDRLTNDIVGESILRKYIRGSLKFVL